MSVALASAFVRLRPEVNKSEWTKSGQESGSNFADGYTRGADGKLRDSQGKFVKDSGAAGGKAGAEFGDGFYRDASGRLRAANGRFATDAEKAAIDGGTRSGKGFAGGFTKGTGRLADLVKSNLKLAAGVFVPLGLGAAVAQIGKIGIAYEDNLNIFKVVTKATGAQMDAVAEKARQLGADVTLPGVSAAGAASAMTELAKAGFTVSQAMDAAKGTLQLARIANINEGDAATIAANAVNAFGIQAKDTGFVVDELAASANSSSVEISDVSQAFQQAASVFSGFQGPAVGSKEAITELNTAIAILGNNGIKGSDAGTSLRQMLLQLTGPTAQAKDLMKDLALKAQGATITLDEQNDVLKGSKKQRDAAIDSILKHNASLKNSGDIAFDAAGKMRPLSQIIDLVSKGTKGMSDEERDFIVTQIFGADASRSVIALLKGGLPVYEAQRKAVLQSGAAADVATAKNKGLGGALDNVKSQFENAAISVYNQVKGPLTAGLNALAGALPGVFSAIGGVFDFLGKHAGTLKVLAGTLATVTAAFVLYKGTLLVVAATEKIVAAAQAVFAFVQLASQVRNVSGAFALLNLVMDANPIGVVVVAIGALVAGLIYAYKNSETFRNIVNAVWAAIKTAIGATVSWITGTAVPFIVKAWGAIESAALFLWHNVIEPVWHGIQAVIGVAVTIVKGYIAALKFEFGIISSVALFLWHNIFQPVFAGIAKAAQIWWLAVQIAFKIITNVITSVVLPIVALLWTRFVQAFNIVKAAAQLWWQGVTTAFNLVKAGVVFLVNKIIIPYFNLIKSFWTGVGRLILSVYNATIGPIISKFITAIRDQLPAAFRKGVDLITKLWGAVKEAARVPVAFVVNHVINPFIGGLNNAAKAVGVKGRVAPIAGFAGGGQYGTDGGKISGAGGIKDNRLAPAAIPGVGAVKLQGGEFIVNRQDTSKALPILRWINAGMKGGAQRIASFIGRPLTNYPGDGSEGWAFKGGGLVGWVKDVWGALSDPIGTIKKPFQAALSNIPGGGTIKDFLVGAGKKVLDQMVGWLTGFGNQGGIPLTGRLGAASSFLRAQNGKPYVWASAGPGGYDCSGIVSAVYNILAGHSPYQHTFSTESLPGPYFRQGQRTGPLIAGWSHPGQSPASASVGHMAGQLAGLPFESSGSRGVHLGGSARSVSQFANIGAAKFAQGGLFDRPVQLFDNGGPWRSGTLGANMSGHTEWVDRRGNGGGEVHEHYHFHNEGVIGSQDELDRWLAKSVTRLKRQKKLP